MAKGKTSAVYTSDPFNETTKPGPNDPDMMGDDLYWGGWPEIMNMHLKNQDIFSTPNTESGDDILGKPAPGEPRADNPRMPSVTGAK